MIVKTESKTKFAIVGGGMLGLTLAMRIAKQGHDVTLIEAAPTLGGLAGVWNCLLYTSPSPRDRG